MTQRYARLALIPGWNRESVSAATVVVIGVGAVGSEVARLLAQSGVGRLVLCDPDQVSESNLSRGALFEANDVGEPKVTVAATTLAKLTPDTRVDARPLELRSGVGLAELREAAVVISCLDSRAARLELATRCNLVEVAMLDGGTHPWGGEVRVFPAGGRCFGCGMSHTDLAVRDDPWSCARPVVAQPYGASGPVSAMIGSWLATFALRMCLGLPVRTGTLRMEATDGAAYWIDEPVDELCPLHETIPPDAVRLVPVTVESTVADLLAVLDPYETALSWVDFPAVSWHRVPTVNLRDALPRLSLRELGVAPREIVPVVRDGRDRRTRYLELAPVPGEDT